MIVVDAILLAAWSSSRLGRRKQLLPTGGGTSLAGAAAAFQGAAPRRLLIVVAAGADELRASLKGAPFAFEVIENRGWQAGLGSSIRAGMAALDRDPPADGVLLGVCDQPLIPAAHFVRLRGVFSSSPDRIVASVHGGTTGVPALFPRALYTELRVLPAAWGVTPVIAHHARRVLRVPCAEAAFDNDTATDYGSLLGDVA
jgi:molybdenum cofactor cytidylyltransferase